MQRIVRLTAISAVLACLGACGPSATSVPQGPEVTGVRVTYMASKPQVVGYLSRPLTPGKHPTLILIHEWWGLNDNIRALADDYARQGYTALAVDLYAGKTAATADEARALSKAVYDNPKEALENLKAAVSYISGSPSADTERLASVGWCFGGSWSYQMAKNDMGVKAAVIYYGLFDTKDDLKKMKASVLGHFGDKDAVIPVESVMEFQKKLEAVSDANEVFMYPNAGHAFANKDGANYDAAATQQSWARTLDFLAKQLQ